ncbi:hypothetical protein ASG31_10685 [Chryseobacterium sp. Leaf404]|uniref:hypothetical protein n=1 Tax=unclassified Chryseobacterium TaxID=2593645 RepID=UPI0006FC9808|nr:MULTISPECIES: hypothetical protein [unclassified Chryseobacterium]KQT16836.1 hypothetical protein ASG31_10685 [Chryseobacterium sp. Leaf404]
MNFSTKSQLILILVLVGMLSAVNSQNKQSTNKISKIDFIEMRRMNTASKLPELSIVSRQKEVLKLYRSLSDSRFSRSAPIPVLEDNEALVVLKPKLRSIKYGDINVSKLEEKNGKLTLYYSETENWEYAGEKQSNPVLIIKIFQKPKSITLKYLKSNP